MDAFSDTLSNSFYSRFASRVSLLSWSASPLMPMQAYDYLTTLDREVSLIWASPWSIAKVLFLLTRYLPFADVAVISYGANSRSVHMGDLTNTNHRSFHPQRLS